MSNTLKLIFRIAATIGAMFVDLVSGIMKGQTTRGRQEHPRVRETAIKAKQVFHSHL